MENKIIGNWGEGVAREYLKNKGYTILEKNWRYHHKELDIIAYKDGLIGIEVKTRNNNANLAFTVLKVEQVARLRSALKAYCFLHFLNYNKTRLDLVIIKIKDKTTVGVTHYYDI